LIFLGFFKPKMTALWLANQTRGVVALCDNPILILFGQSLSNRPFSGSKHGFYRNIVVKDNQIRIVSGSKPSL